MGGKVCVRLCMWGGNVCVKVCMYVGAGVCL